MMVLVLALVLHDWEEDADDAEEAEAATLQRTVVAAQIVRNRALCVMALFGSSIDLL